MKTSKEWWNEVKNDEALFIEWLKKQYHGEWVATRRIAHLWEDIGGGTHYENTMIAAIVEQESTHAEWIAQLLENRGVEPAIIAEHEERYWKETLRDVTDVASFAAVAAHAEEMRLGRIRAIVNDGDTPTDVRLVFLDILDDEEFHAKAFRRMTTDEEYNRREEDHVKGAEAIGLVA